jgi:short-subunit dehydrogenase
MLRDYGLSGVDERKSVFYYQCDITSRDAVHQAGEAIRSDLGSPSILINNAGIGTGSNILDVAPEQLNNIFQVNLLSHWYTVQEFLPGMIAKKKGHVMSTASLASFVSLAGSVDYSCTKAALVAFHEGLIQELKHRYQCPQIKTSIIYPYWTRTGLTAAIEKGIRGSGAPLAEPADVAKAMVKQITSQRSGHVVLGSAAAAYVRFFPTWLQEIIRDSQSNIVVVNASTAVA